MATYSCAKCGMPCTKPPLVKPTDDVEQLGLGKWQCPHCGRNVKVKRQK